MSGPRSKISIIALPTATHFQAGDSLVDAIDDALRAAKETLQPYDVLLITSKVVSLTENAVVTRPQGDLTQARRDQARRDADSIVADSPHVLVTRTHHGFVAANGGIDASNMADGTKLLLLPHDPDGSAASLREAIQTRHGVPTAVIITDTFGRAWRMGQTDVALGVSGISALRDERGQSDLYGHTLDVTEAAVADALAGASDLVRTKASGTPFVLVRGVDPALFADTKNREGATLVRPADRDLFRFGGPTAVEEGLGARRTVRQFEKNRLVDEQVLTKAVEAALSVSAPHHATPWQFVQLTDTTRDLLLTRMAALWQHDLARDGVSDTTIAARREKSDRVLRDAPTLLAAFVSLDGAHTYPDRRRSRAEQNLFLLSGGAAIQNFQVTLSAHGAASAWLSAPLFCTDVVRLTLRTPATWYPVGFLACGYPVTRPAPRQQLAHESHFHIR